jgi:hypothetical protein
VLPRPSPGGDPSGSLSEMIRKSDLLAIGMNTYLPLSDRLLIRPHRERSPREQNRATRSKSGAFTPLSDPLAALRHRRLVFTSFSINRRPMTDHTPVRNIVFLAIADSSDRYSSTDSRCNTVRALHTHEQPQAFPASATFGAGAQHDFSCATRATRSPLPSPYSVFSPVVWKVSHEMPAGSSIHDFSDLA